MPKSQPERSARYRIKRTAKAKRAYRLLSPRLQQEVTNALQEIENEGLDVVAEELERELVGRHKVKVNGHRMILMQKGDLVILLDIRRRNRLTYLNLPII